MKKTALDHIVEYQERTRQIGHTYSMLYGAAPAGSCFIVVGNIDQKNNMIRNLHEDVVTSKSRVLTLNQVRDGVLERMYQAGFIRPLVIDNAALWEIHREEKQVIEGEK